jgi:hypothetical protein
VRHQSDQFELPSEKLSVRRRLTKIATIVFVAIGMMAWAGRSANGAAIAWDNSASTFDQRWVYQFNWNPDVVPTGTSDVTLTAITPNLRIDAEGEVRTSMFPPFGPVFQDPALATNSLTISTHNSFTVDGRISFGFFQTGLTSLTLTTGDLTRLDVAGEEGNQLLDLNVLLAADGLWDVRGSGVLSVSVIRELGGARTFTKTGPGTLSTGNGALGTNTGAIITSGATTSAREFLKAAF